MIERLLIELFIGLSTATIVEGGVFYLLSFNKINDFLFIFKINLLTNPLLNIIIYISYLKSFYSNKLVLLLEMLVVLIEGLLINNSYHTKIKKSLLISLTTNLASYLADLIIIRFL